MKKLSFFMFSVMIFLFACSSNDKSPAQETPSSSEEAPSTSLMDEGPVYDPFNIDANAEVSEVTVKATGNNMDEMKYDVTEIKVKDGSTVKLKLVNEGSDAAMLHNLVIIKNGTADEVAKESIAAGPDKNFVASSSDVLVATELLQPKGETVLTFAAPAKGTYEFICTYPGHYQKMRGIFIVE